MKKHLLLAYLLVWGTIYTVFAQFPKNDTLLYKPSAIMYLKPIVTANNGRFYYGGQRLRNSYSLEIPFGELNDVEVNRYFKNARTIRTVGSIVSALPSIYFLLVGRNNRVSRQFFWTSYIASIGVSFTSNFIAGTQMRKAINTYNIRLTQPRLGLSVQEVNNNALAVGLSMKVGIGR